MVTALDLIRWLTQLSSVYRENREYLTDLDSAIGDADHGINLDRGFSAVKEMLESSSFSSAGNVSAAGDDAETGHTSISGVLKNTAMVLIKSVGGASGPLLGTFFLNASRAVKNEDNISLSELTDILDAGVEGIKMRGKAEAGEKTMLDAWIPAVKAMKEEVSAGEGLQSILLKGTNAAEKGMENTRDMTAKKGRASYLGERSRGHIDPGAASAFMMIKTLSDIFSRTG